MRNLRIAAAWAAGEIHKYLGGVFSPEKKNHIAQADSQQIQLLRQSIFRKAETNRA